MVDTAGLLLAVVVHPADVPDRDGARLVLGELAGKMSRLRLIWADGAYRGALSKCSREWLGCRLEIVPRKAGRVVLRYCRGVGQWRARWAGWVGNGV